MDPRVGRHARAVVPDALVHPIVTEIDSPRVRYVDLPGAEVEIMASDEELGTASVHVVVPWSALLAIDSDGDMSETGTVRVTAQLSQREDRSFAFTHTTFEVSYKNLFTEDENEVRDGNDLDLSSDGVF